MGFVNVYHWRCGPLLEELGDSGPAHDDAWTELVALSHDQGRFVYLPKIANVCVTPSQRRTRVGDRPVKESCSQAAKWGFPFVLLLVDEDNKAARRFYRTLGFRRGGDAEEYVAVRPERQVPKEC